jgi:hypothetical protein
MKYLKIIIFIVFPILSFSQYFGPSDVKDSLIKNNLVFKYIEYDAEDSVKFFENHPNGYYGIYNRQGQIIEKNAFSGGDIVEEFFVHYIYDDQGRNIMWLWYQPNSINKITRIRIEEFDSLGNNYGYKDFNGNEKYSDAYKTRNYWKADHPNPIETIDSITSKSKKTYYYFSSQDKTDTLEIKTMYYTKNRLDSICSFFKRKNYPFKATRIFTYFKSNKIEVYEYYSFNSEGQINQCYKTIYSENELPIEKWYTYYYEGKENTTHSKFRYEYYKPK